MVNNNPKNTIVNRKLCVKTYHANAVKRNLDDNLLNGKEVMGLWSRSRHLGPETYQRSRLGLISRKILSTSRSRLGLGHLRLVPTTNFRPNCAGHSTQFETA